MKALSLRSSCALLGLCLLCWKLVRDLHKRLGKCQPPALSHLAMRTYDKLQNAPPSRHVPAAVQVLHPTPPHLPKQWWNALGNALKLREDAPRISGERWYTLRLDGTGFSKFIPKLRKRGVFQEHGHCPVFANIMVEVAKALMTKFSASVAYTQSDEVTLVIKPMPQTRKGHQEVHLHAGRTLKLCTLAAATATAVFNRHVFELLPQGEGIDFGSLLATFDCRIAEYREEREALSLILWRSYDCSVNAVSDAVHHAAHLHLSGRKEAIRQGTGEKLAWLNKNGMLPLPDHQAVGTLLVKKKILMEALNPKTGDAVEVMRSTIHKVPGHFLQLVSQCPENESPIEYLANHAVPL